MNKTVNATPVKNRVALVTGANRGIGKAIVEALLAEGASKVYLAVRDPESTTELAQQYGDKVVTLQADLSDDASVAGLPAQAGDVDIVINNGGLLEPASALSDNAASALANEMDVNVYGLLRIAQAFAPQLQRKRGALVQLNSVASVMSFPDFATYSASKSASYSLTQALAKQLGEKGVQVVSVHPGPIATAMAEKAGIMENADSPSVVAAGIVNALNKGDFHVFPDAVARQVFEAYSSFAHGVVEAAA